MLPLLLAAGLAQAGGSTREERVLALLGEVSQARSWHYADTIFESRAPPLGSSPVLVPRLCLVLCGTRDHFAFDDARARRLALELCAIYGLTMEADRLEPDGPVSVSLDGLDERARIGFELRGHCDRETCEVQQEEGAAAFDEDAFDLLVAHGIRLHVADVDSYRAYLDGFTPMLAYLASLVTFLNDVTEGENVDLGGLLFEREAAWLPRFVSSEGLKVESGWGAGLELVVERPTSLSFVCRGLTDFQTAPERDPWGLYETPDQSFERRQLRSTRGAPAVLHLKGEALASSPGGPRPDFCLRLRQVVDGSTVERESHSYSLFLPGRVDLTQPFEFELDLTPGRYVLRQFRIGAAASR